MQQAPPPDLSVVVPVWNEEANLRPLLRELLPVLGELGGAVEVLLVDDGSSDGSREVARELAAADPRVRPLPLPAHAGKGAALAAGFAAAAGEVVVTLDADLQSDPRDIRRLLEALERCDLASGRRRNRADGPWRALVSRLGNGVRNLLTGERIRDSASPLKAARAPFLRAMRLTGGLHRFLPTLARLEGARVLEIDVAHRPRLHGASHYRLLGRGVQGIRDIAAVRRFQRARRR